MVGPGVGGPDGESVFHGDRVSVWGIEKVLEMMVGMVAQQYDVLNATAVHLEMVKMISFMLCAFYQN